MKGRSLEGRNEFSAPANLLSVLKRHRSKEHDDTALPKLYETVEGRGCFQRMIYSLLLLLPLPFLLFKMHWYRTGIWKEKLVSEHL